MALALDDRRLALEHHREALANADANRGNSHATTVGFKLARKLTDDSRARGAKRVANRDCAAVNVHFFGVEVFPKLHAGQGLRGERFVDLNKINIGPSFAGARESDVRGFDGRDAKNVGVVGGYATRNDAGKRLTEPRVFARDQNSCSAVAEWA